MLFCFTKTLWPGVSPGPPTASPRHVHGHGNVPARHLPETGAEPRDRIARQVVGTGRRGPPVSRSAVESDASTRFGAAILHREDVEFLGRKPETGVLLPLPGSSSCVTGDPTASDSAKPAAKRLEWP